MMLSGRATAFARFVLGGKKEYAALIRFGEQTDTDDGEGNIVYRAAVPPNLADPCLWRCPLLLAKKNKTAPAHSALKHAGKPLYYYARRGLPAPLKKRTTTVHHLSVIRAGKKTAKLKIVCGGGFYVRSLARDLGEQLGCGAHLHAFKTAGGRAILIYQTLFFRTLCPKNHRLNAYPACCRIGVSLTPARLSVERKGDNFFLLVAAPAIPRRTGFGKFFHRTDALPE